MKESQVITLFRLMVESWIPGAFVLKLAQGPFSLRGLPDLLVGTQGKVALIEAKQKKGRLSPVQKATLDRLALSDAPIGLLYGVDASQVLLQRWGTPREYLLNRKEGPTAFLAKYEEFLRVVT